MAVLNIFVVGLTVVCAALTVAFLGTLRGVTEVRLRLAGAGSEGTQFRLDAGTALSEALLGALPDPRALGLLLFLSEDCAACWRLVDELSTLELNGAAVTVCLTGSGTGKMRARLHAGVTVVDPDAAAQAVKQFKIDATPVVVVHRDGYVTGSAHGSSAESVETIKRLWSASAAPDGFRVLNPQPLSFANRPDSAARAASHSAEGS